MHAIFALLTWMAIAMLMGYIGRDKKFGFWGNFAVTLLLTPIVGIIVYFAQTDAHPRCHSGAAAKSDSKDHDHSHDHSHDHPHDHDTAKASA